MKCIVTNFHCTAVAPNNAVAQNFLLFLLPYVLAILFVMTAFTTSGFLLQALADEKEDRVMEILATSLRPSQMMAGKIIGLSALGLTQIGSWLAWVGVGLAFICPIIKILLDSFWCPVIEKQ